MEIIKRKLKERHDQKYNPQPGDKITNPHSAHKTVEEKRAAYNAAMDQHERAYTGFKEYIHVGDPGAEFNNVEYIAGLWRVQRPFPYEITQVRDRQFVLVDKLSYTEHTHFDFYSAANAVWSGTGASANVDHPEWVVAKYDTDKGTYSAYGRDIASARAFLGIKLYDEYQDLIDSVARKNILNGILPKKTVTTPAKNKEDDSVDRITNPEAIQNYGTAPLYTDVAGKRVAYDAAVANGAMAIDSNLNQVRLGENGATFNQVEYMSGYWRIQTKFEHEITKVRDKELVIGKKLAHKERIPFEFYDAYTIGITCYGQGLFPTPDYIVAKYETDNGIYMSYGRTIEEARAFLGIKLYDEYQDLIDATIRTKSRQK